MTGPLTLADLMADPGELDVSYLDCHHNTTMPVAALLPRYGAETPFPGVWSGFRCSACGDRGGSTFGLTGRPARRQDSSRPSVFIAKPSAAFGKSFGKNSTPHNVLEADASLRTLTGRKR
jgi:hypothetical protein